MRSFVAFPVEEPLLSYVTELQAELQNRKVKGKWVKPANQHLTVLFLGEQDQEHVDKLAEELNKCKNDYTALDMTPAGVNTLGRPPRVVYLDWGGPDRQQFIDLAEFVKGAVQNVGMTVDQKTLDRTSLPHLTLLRFRHRKEAKCLRELGELHKHGFEWYTPLPEPRFTSVCFKYLCIYTSELYPEGPEHSITHRVTLPEHV